MAPPIRTDQRTTRVALEPPDDGGGGAVLHLAAGLLAPRVVSRSTVGAHVALVATTATLLGGDLVDLDVTVGPGLRLDLTDVAGTVAYHGRGRDAQVRARLRVGEGATLVWAGEPLVVAEGAQVERRLVAEVAAGGRLLLRDQVVLGREGEDGGSLRCHTEVAYAGGPALVETLDLRTRTIRDAPGILGGARVVDTVTAVGWRPDALRPGLPGTATGLPGVSVYTLAAPGAQARTLVGAAHESALPRLWDLWLAAMV